MIFLSLFSMISSAILILNSNTKRMKNAKDAPLIPPILKE